MGGWVSGVTGGAGMDGWWWPKQSKHITTPYSWWKNNHKKKTKQTWIINKRVWMENWTGHSEPSHFVRHVYGYGSWQFSWGEMCQEKSIRLDTILVIYLGNGHMPVKEANNLFRLCFVKEKNFLKNCLNVSECVAGYNFLCI